MIPLKIQLKNFLSYGPQTQIIDFSNYQLICLSGKNGHGKSALLDALTWAIWGQARKLSGNAKADQGLLRLGQTQMMVCLDFACGPQQFRIRREYMQTYGKPLTTLDFGYLDNDRFIPLTEKTIRDTQEKIEKTLHLTYEGFINSAFLRQGQANEFSKKSAKERKDVLASILGLDQYETIRKLASEKVRQLNLQKQHVTLLNTKLVQELAQEPIILQKIEELQHKYQSIEHQEEDLTKQKKILEQDLLALQNNKQACDKIQFQLQQQTNEQESIQNTLRSLFAQWKKVHKQKLVQNDFSSLEQKKKDYLIQVKIYQDALQQQLILKQDLLNNKEQLSQFVQIFNEKKIEKVNAQKIAIERLFVEKSHLETKIKEVTNKKELLAKDRLLLQQELQTFQSAKHCHNDDISSFEKQFEKRKEYYQKWVTLANMINAELTTLDKKNKLVHDEESPSCPLCEQNLSASRKRFLKKKFEADSTFLKYRFKKLSSIIKKLKEILYIQHSRLQELKSKQQQEQLRSVQQEEVDKKLHQNNFAYKDAEAEQDKYLELLKILNNTIIQEQQALGQLMESNKQALNVDQSYQALQKKIQLIEQDLSKNIYNQEHHTQLLKEYEQLEKQFNEYQELQKQLLFQAQRADQIHSLCLQLKKIKADVATLSAQWKEKNTISAQESAVLTRKQEIESAFNACFQVKEQLLEEKGKLNNQKTSIDLLKQELLQNNNTMLQYNELLNDYQAITLATGKDGIQALLIEDAIPEIEHETNELLAKLTDNQTQLFIESLRDLKKGGTKETLDIKISDAAGIRAYELFSGGEAFRIDFALRIAISKLLARRAGTSLQTLIIDEGFGSQDEEGLAHIMDAIYKIQEDFARVIIVSHLASMKSNFPIHFMINKGPNGSEVEIFEQG